MRLLLTDINMPEVDGIALVEWIRADTGLRDLPVITLTSGSRPEDLARLESLQVVASLMKPVKRSELYDAVCLGLSGGAGPNVPTKEVSPPLPELRPLRVLLVEDSLVNQRLAVGLLEKHGHQVTVAANGKEALAELARGTFDVVLMDVEMPEMDGLEATAEIRKRELQTAAHVPIIAMTAHALQGDRQRCLDAGMDAYVPKPMRTRQLFEVIQSLL